MAFYWSYDWYKCEDMTNMGFYLVSFVPRLVGLSKAGFLGWFSIFIYDNLTCPWFSNLKNEDRLRQINQEKLPIGTNWLENILVIVGDEKLVPRFDAHAFAKIWLSDRQNSSLSFWSDNQRLSGHYQGKFCLEIIKNIFD